MVAPLSFPKPDRSPWVSDRSDSSPRSASLAVVVGSLVVLALVSGAFWAGRMVEQRSQFGKALMLAPALEDLTAATRFQDSVSMQYVILSGRLRRGTALRQHPKGAFP